MSTPLQLYRADIQEKGHVEDPQQAEAIAALDQLYLNIERGEVAEGASLYLWGPVGRGKTYVMDCFYRALQGRAQRLHYYRFMQYLHQQLRVFQGNKDPLVLVAKALLKEHKVLCLDEFFVSDIADAMLLGRLLKVLFEQGLILVTTSNIAPSELYRDGLQRDRFLPAIAMLEQNLQIISLQGDADHRLTKGQNFSNYYLEGGSSGLSANAQVVQRFHSDAGDRMVSRDLALNIESRTIDCLYQCDDLYCFSFQQLFVGPRSANDYIALSKIASCIYLLDVPQLGGVLNERKVARGTEDTYNINQRVANRPFVMAKGDDEARRFISFIDEMYDQRTGVVMAAAVQLPQLYLGGRVEFEFQRASSRIIEMQSAQYCSSDR
ncbi:MAG: cell division protein ZapE [Pseudomonadales bacterium]|nr:cell division protein ZapE [Pseudomonadales bacterium]